MACRLGAAGVIACDISPLALALLRHGAEKARANPDPNPYPNPYPNPNPNPNSNPNPNPNPDPNPNPNPNRRPAPPTWRRGPSTSSATTRCLWRTCWCAGQPLSQPVSLSVVSTLLDL